MYIFFKMLKNTNNHLTTSGCSKPSIFKKTKNKQKNPAVFVMRNKIRHNKMRYACILYSLQQVTTTQSLLHTVVRKKTHIYLQHNKSLSFPDQMVSHSNGGRAGKKKGQRQSFCDSLQNYKTGFESFQMLSYLTCQQISKLVSPNSLKSSAKFPAV